MAFQSALLPNLSAAAAETWPSVANSLLAPWKAPTTATTTPRHLPSSHSPAAQSRPVLPQCLRDYTPTRQLPPSAASSQLTPCDIRSAVASMSPFALASVAHPLGQRSALRFATPSRTSPMRRMFSTAVPLVARPAPRLLSSLGLSPHTLFSQKRGFANGGISRNQLANLEAAANRNPNSATAQNAFYQVLLKANMPAIILERYNSGRYAKNQAVDEVYAKALAMLSANKPVDMGAGIPAQQIPGGLSEEQLQAISQAVAARSRGGNLAISVPPAAGVSKDGRIHVQVDETAASWIFKWTRFLFGFGLVCYISFMVIYMLVDSLNSLKRTGTTRADAEVKAESQKARFSDVHGCDEAKEELQELVDFLRNPEKFSALGGKLPKGVLLVGPPGTGKTLLARAVAGEAGVPFFYMSGSEFDEIYVGVGAKRVRDLFNAARAKSPAIIFIDELDAIGGKRNSRDSTYVKQTLNQLLTELDGFDQSSQIIIIAATNFPQLLDKALTRPGRFDRHVQVDLPDVRGRLAILKFHAKKIKLMEGINLQELAQDTSGLSGAELENIVNSAAIHASKNKSSVVTMQDLIWAKDKIVMGAEKKSMVLSEKEKLMTAYHEAGHALMSLFSETQSFPLYKVTILPRGNTLGHTAFLPDMDKVSWTSADYASRIDTSLGGKVAEEIIYGNNMVTSGASSDLEAATNTAFAMVAYYGMGRGLPPMNYGSRYDQLSPSTRAKVENEVQRLLNEAYKRTRDKLEEKRKELELLAEALVDYETLDKAEVLKVIKGETLPDRIKMPRSAKMAVPLQPADPTEGLPPLGGRGEDHGGSGAPPAPPAVA